MSKKVAQLLDGVSIQLKDGTTVTCQPLSLRETRVLMEEYNRVVAPTLPETATPQELATDERERQQAMIKLLDAFAAAVGRPELADDKRFGPGDLLRVLPGFFWKGTGAKLVETQPPSRASTGTGSGASTSPPSA